MTNKELADLVGTDEGTVSRWVHGKQAPGRKRKESLEHLLGVRPGTLQAHGTHPTPGVAQHHERNPTTGPISSSLTEPLDESRSETPPQVMRAFNRWLDPFLHTSGSLKPVDVAEWMQRMWRASTKNAPGPDQIVEPNPTDPDRMLDIEIEPGTGVAITTSKGRAVVVNQALSAILELDPDKIVGRYVWELNAPEYRDAGKQRIRKQRSQPWDVELITGAGRRVPVTISNVHCHLRGHPVRVALVKVRDENGGSGDVT